jgi:uncharacterized surface protein with fasciclin (FAS1) repeats
MKAMKKMGLFVAAGLMSMSLMAQSQNDVVGVAAASADHTTLVAAVKAADLVSTLQGSGPFTVFAPTNAAFGKLPEGTLNSLMEPANKSTLAGILSYHVVAGNFSSKALLAAITEGKGKAILATVAGGKLTATLEQEKVVITDEKGGKAIVATADIAATNGVVHVIDAVLLPASK